MSAHELVPQEPTGWSTPPRESPWRLVLIEDHPLIAAGFARVCEGVADFDLVAHVRSFETLDLMPVPADLVVLDLRLGDGSVAALNVATLRRRGLPVLIYSEADDPAMVRAAMRAGALGAIRKGDSPAELLEGLRAARRGETVMSLEIACAIDSDMDLDDAKLSEREQQILGLYAQGATAQQVSSALCISRSSVLEYLRRIRTKYVAVGRAATTRVDLFDRAFEDRLVETER